MTGDMMRNYLCWHKKEVRIHCRCVMPNLYYEPFLMAVYGKLCNSISTAPKWYPRRLHVFSMKTLDAQRTMGDARTDVKTIARPDTLFVPAPFRGWGFLPTWNRAWVRKKKKLRNEEKGTSAHNCIIIWRSLVSSLIFVSQHSHLILCIFFPDSHFTLLQI